MSCMISWSQTQERPSSCDSRPTKFPAFPVRCPTRLRLHRSEWSTSVSATFTAHIKPGTPPIAPMRDEWGYRRFHWPQTPRWSDALTPQDGLYTLITRSGEGDTFELIGALSAVHAAADHEAYLDYLSRPEVAVVTITVTEAAYLRGADGHLDAGLDVIVSDLEALRSDPRNPVASLPARLVAGLVARRTSGASALTILSCDNLPENGAVTKTVVQDFAALLDETLGDWINSQVDFATSMVDRITPRTTDEDRALVQQACGYVDAYPVATEPFSEWVISGGFPAGRPRWEEAGATIVAEVGTLRAAQALAAQRVTLDARLRRQHPGTLDDR